MISNNNKSVFSDKILSCMSHFVASCEKRLGNLAEKIIVDIGCYDGSLLNLFRDKGAITIGVESNSKFLNKSMSSHTLYCADFSENIASAIVKKHGNPDLIVSINCFSGMGLNLAVNTLKKLVGSNTFLVIENLYLESMCTTEEHNPFYGTFPRIYSYESFYELAMTLKLEIIDVEFPNNHGGNIRTILGNPKSVVGYSMHTEVYGMRL